MAKAATTRVSLRSTPGYGCVGGPGTEIGMRAHAARVRHSTSIGVPQDRPGGGRQARCRGGPPGSKPGWCGRRPQGGVAPRSLPKHRPETEGFGAASPTFGAFTLPSMDERCRLDFVHLRRGVEPVVARVGRTGDFVILAMLHVRSRERARESADVAEHVRRSAAGRVRDREIEFIGVTAIVGRGSCSRCTPRPGRRHSCRRWRSPSASAARSRPSTSRRQPARRST